jgi:type I restriction enzyme S subunit
MKNWSEKKLDDICELITCGVAAKPQYVSDGIPFLSAKNVKEGKIVWSGYNYVSEKTHIELTKNNKPKVGDILYTRVGSYGEACVIEDDIEFSIFVSLTLIKVDNFFLNSYYLKHYLNSDYVKRLAKKSISGSGVGNLNVGTVRNFPILLPPLPEQERIVSIIDAAFVTISKAKANAEQNLKNSKELFDSYLQGVFENGNWETKTLNEISDNLDSKRVPITKNVRNEGSIPYYGASGIVDYVSDYLFEEDLLCVSEDGANLLARTYPIAFSISGKTWVNNHAHVLRFKNMVSQKFVELYLNSIKLNDFVSGMAQPKLNQTMLNKIPIPFPSLKEQGKIVSSFDALSSETQKLQTIYHTKIKDLEELKKSVLQKAFSGEL